MTILYLDIDGVLSPYAERSHGKRRSWDDFRPHYITFGERDFATLHLSPEMLAQLAALDVEIRWATTWGENANTVVAPLIGWPDKIVATQLETWDHTCVDRRAWKRQSIQEDVANHTEPFIWIDDELEGRDTAWAKLLRRPALVLRPDSGVGITRNDIRDIEQFIDRNHVTPI